MGAGIGELVEVTPDEYVALLGADTDFFNHEFFPDTVRQVSPEFHRLMDAVLDDPDKRFVNFQVFRGGAKTTKLRTYAMKRICFGVSRTIVIVGKSQDHSKLTLSWIKNQVTKNRKLSATFKLKKGEKWADDIIQIENGVTGQVIWIVAYGILGSIRGVNIEDHRPDLILVDDVVDDENALTQEQRRKTENLVLGALKQSLAPASEAPLAKMVILQTPLDREDLSCKAMSDPEFHSLQFGCWTEETRFLSLEARESAWPERWSSEVLRREKLNAIAANRLSLFSREMECLLVTPETAAFREEWLQYWGDGPNEMVFPPRHEMWVELVIDPVPPPSPAQLEKGLQGKDYEAFTVIARWKGKIILCETSFNRGHEPSWTVSEFFRLCSKWNPRKVMVEAVAYQRTLGWLLRQGMKQAGRYWLVEEFVDKRAKDVKIKDGLTGVASNRQLFVNRALHAEFISQFVAYGAAGGSRMPDDVIETVALGCTSLQKGSVAGDDTGGYIADETDIPDLEYARGAP